MADVTISPNMGLPVPNVAVAPGPDWANDLNACLSIVDGHSHVAGSGVQITPAAININADLPFNQTNNLTEVRSVRFQPLVTAIPAVTPDLGCLYEAGVDLYYNDGNGNQIRITQSGSVTGASGTITGLPSGTASASYSAASGTFIFQQATSTGANIDVATVIIRYPGSYPTPAGNYIALEAPASLSTGYAFILPNNLPLASGALLTSNTSGNISYTNVDNSTLEISSSTIQVKDSGITQIKLAPMPAAVFPTSANAGEIAVSASTSNGTTGSTTYVPVVSVTIATTGRPVRLQIESDGGGNSSYLTSTGPAWEAFFYRDATQLSRQSCGGGNTTGSLGGTVTTGPGAGGNISTTGALNLAGILYPSSTFSHIDYSVPAGTYTYQFGVAATSGGTVSIINLILVAYEI